MRPALASSLALVVIGVTAGALWLSLARRHETPKFVAVNGPNQGTAVNPKAVNPAAPARGNGGVNAPVETIPNGGETVEPPAKQGAPREAGPRPERAGNIPEQPVHAPEPDVRALIDEPLTPPPSGNVVVFKPDNHDARQDSPLLVNVLSDDKGVVTAEARLADPEDKEVAQHVERAQMLLRSFKNARPAEGDTVDVAYEKSHARKLLAENATLQLDAETRGDKDTQQVLDRIEPFLLDIANLRDQPSREEVRSIKERMQKNEIIAALQVY
jgi:hypothetical protein